MTANSAPPLQHPVVDKNGNITMPWAEFFSNMFGGDAGEPWTPVFTSLTETGGDAAITGTYSRLNQNAVIFTISITPATSVSATAGTTYATGFPLGFIRDTVCHVGYGGLGGESGHVDAATGRIYIPALSSVADTVVITGVGFAE